MNRYKSPLFSAAAFSMLLLSCNQSESSTANEAAKTDSTSSADTSKYLSQPLVSHIYTADPSAHVFNGRIYIYPSHDTSTGTAEDDLGSHFDMRDYHVLSMDSVGGKVTDHGVALDIRNIPWAGRQLWAPDAAFSLMAARGSSFSPLMISSGCLRF